MNEYYGGNDWRDYCLAHHGIQGQKWGIRRYQNEDGSLTAAGKERYYKSGALGTVGRALTNTAVGQKLAVRINKGYREDRAEIKSEYKKSLSELDKNSSDYKQKKKELKSNYRKDKVEAATTAADVIYGGQSHKMNERVQNDSVGKAFLKSFLMGGYGSLKYNEVRSNDYGRAASAISAVLLGSLDNATMGAMEVADYAIRESGQRGKKISHSDIYENVYDVLFG